MGEALHRGGLTNYIKHFDDLFLFMKSMKELVKVFQDLLEICHESKIMLQPKKIGLSSLETGPVKYAGLSVSHLSISPHEEKLEAITNMKPPKDVSETRAYLGMINQMKHFPPDLTCNLYNIRTLQNTRAWHLSGKKKWRNNFKQ